MISHNNIEKENEISRPQISNVAKSSFISTYSDSGLNSSDNKSKTKEIRTFNFEENANGQGKPSKSEFHPIIWTSLGLLWGFLLAIGLEVRILTSHYHFYARFLQSPGTVVANILIIL